MAGAVPGEPVLEPRQPFGPREHPCLRHIADVGREGAVRSHPRGAVPGAERGVRLCPRRDGTRGVPLREGPDGAGALPVRGQLPQPGGTGGPRAAVEQRGHPRLAPLPRGVAEGAGGRGGRRAGVPGLLAGHPHRVLRGGAGAERGLLVQQPGGGGGCEGGHREDVQGARPRAVPADHVEGGRVQPGVGGGERRAARAHREARGEPRHLSLGGGPLPGPHPPPVPGGAEVLQHPQLVHRTAQRAHHLPLGVPFPGGLLPCLLRQGGGGADQPRNRPHLPPHPRCGPLGEQSEWGGVQEPAQRVPERVGGDDRRGAGEAVLQRHDPRPAGCSGLRAQEQPWELQLVPPNTPVPGVDEEPLSLSLSLS
eukprot:Sspe_Gene.31496::Locus_15533_Transcript_1_5_Confidence_0.500_Length_2236::g.31496::m.31496